MIGRGWVSRAHPGSPGTMTRVTSSARPAPTVRPEGTARAAAGRPLSLRPSPTSVLHLFQVTMRRGQTLLLDRVDFNADADQRWVVLGPNGAGKTTLLQIAAATLHPTSGRAHVLGARLGAVNVADLRPRIGVSSAALAGRVSPQETARNVVISAGYGQVGRWRERYDAVDTERAEQMLAAMGVAAFAERLFGTLSEGERKRVLAARALMADPELLLLDEPAAGLDLAGREDLVARLSALAKDPDSPATILVTHHVEEIPTGFDHLLLLRGGQVVAAGPIEQVLTKATLSDTFGMRLTLQRRDGRFFAYRR